MSETIKTIIADTVIKKEGKSDTILPSGTTIAFIIGNTRLNCKATSEGLEIYKLNDEGYEEGRITVIGHSGNKVYVR